MRIVPIALISDDNYIMPMSVLLTSLKETKSADTIYKIYIVSDSLSAETVSFFRNFNSTNFLVETIIVENKYKNIQSLNNYVTNSSYLKFDIPSLLNDYDKILYIDTDTVVCKDLYKMYSTKLGDTFAGVIPDYFIYKSQPKRANALNLKNYFNSGVLLLNAKEFRENKLDYFLSLFCKKYGLKTGYRDQDSFNVNFKDNITILSPIYNWLNIYGLFQKEEIFPQNLTTLREEDITIVHYAGPQLKPWIYENVPFSKEWLRFYNLSPYKDKVLNLKPFSIKRRRV